MNLRVQISAGLATCIFAVVVTPVHAQSPEQMRAAARCVDESHRYQHHLTALTQLTNIRSDVEVLQDRIESQGLRDSDDPAIQEEIRVADTYAEMYELWDELNRESGRERWLMSDCPLPVAPDMGHIRAQFEGTEPTGDPLERSRFHPAAIGAACDRSSFNFWCYMAIGERQYVSDVAPRDLSRVTFEDRDRVCRSMRSELDRLERAAGSAAPDPEYSQRNALERMRTIVHQALASPEERPRLYREFATITERAAANEYHASFGEGGDAIRLLMLRNTMDWDWCRRTGGDPRDGAFEQVERLIYRDELAWCVREYDALEVARDEVSNVREQDRFNQRVGRFNDRCVRAPALRADIIAVCGDRSDGYCERFSSVREGG